MTDSHAWEQSKENTAPLPTGRHISTLAPRAFGASREDETKVHKYEKIVRRSEKASEWLCLQAEKLRSPGIELSDEQIEQLKQRLSKELGYNFTQNDTDNNIDSDPLKYWILYIKHIRTAYPSDTQRQFLLMERCTRTFLSTPFLHPSYMNDPRLIRTCILYADKTSSPNDVFKRMNSLKVGQTVALFWVAWAWVAEKRGDYSFCEKIFQKAQRVNAEPKKFLVERERQFLRRMSRHWLNTTKCEESLEEEGGREALNSLRGDDRRGVETNRASVVRQRERSNATTNVPATNSAFAIFQDENSTDHDGLDDENGNAALQLTKECERTKENNMRAERWNERGYGLHSNGPTAGGGGVDSIVGSSRGQRPYGITAAPTPAFDVFVDEEFEDDDNAKQPKPNSKVDDRSLRQRLDGGTADRIRRDPLRYMKNPSKVAADKEKYDRPLSSDAHATQQQNDKVVKEVEPMLKPRKGGYDKELLKNASGHECCFEEQRVMAKYYKLSSSDSDFNLVKQSQTEDMNTSQMEVDESIEEVDMEEMIDTKCTSQRLKSALKPLSSTSDFNTSVVDTRRVLFGANTEFPNKESLNASTASSQPDESFVRDREETINTKFANAEISMMFCSPNNNDSVVDPSRSFMASTCKKPLFSTSRKKASDHSQLDEANGASFAIFEDNTTGPPVSDEKPAAGSSFAIFQDDASANKPVANENARPKQMGSFVIFEEEGKDCVDSSGLVSKLIRKHAAESNGDETATLSELNKVLGDEGLNFEIHNDSAQKPRQQASKPPRAVRNFPLRREVRDIQGDATASLSDIGAMLGDIQRCSINESNNRPPSSGSFTIFSDENDHSAHNKSEFTIHDENAEDTSNTKSACLGFDIFSDENPSSCQKKRKVDEPSFGDISRIDNDERTTNFQILDENALSPAPINAVDYDSKHKRDMESALRECMNIASKSSCDLQIFDYRGKQIPRELLCKSFCNGFTIDLFGGRTVKIIHELGRGVHGVVLLCADESTKEYQNDALKIQAPIGSLAHEYSILLRLEEKINLDSSGFYPFPQPQALYAFSEGGLFVMSAGSDSGMTLLDVVNTCKKSIGSVPEILAIYYTTRMMKHLECLHRDGKILHCDIKPDNWVLTKSSKEAGIGAVSGADLMLVDFGRAIDLSNVSSTGSKPLFTGSVAAEDMECRAMRQGLSWGIDIDYYGICASSYTLLFGSHMEVIQDKVTGKLKLKRPFRRYWQRTLWSKYFEALLNYDASATSESSLANLCVTFDEYLDEKGRRREIESRISTLYTHLPKKR